MKGFSTELKVGLFAVIVIVILSFMTLKVGGFEWLRKKEGYTVYVYFRNIAGLDEKTKVKVAGVDSGLIKQIGLEKDTAKVELRVDRDVRLFSDSSASIKAAGLLGDKYLEIKPGHTPPMLNNGDTISNVIEIVDLDDMIRNITNVSANFNTLATSLVESIGTKEAKTALRESIINLRTITQNLNEAISVNDEKLRIVLDNIKTLSVSLNGLIDQNREPLATTIANMRDFSGSLKSDAPELIKNLNMAAKELKSMVEENKPAITNTVESVRAMVEENRPAIRNATKSIDSITQRIERGEGSLGKLVKDDRLYESVNKAAEGVEKTISAIDRFRTFITFQADYLSRPKDSKGSFTVTLQPRPDKYYIVGIVQDPVGRITTRETITTGTSGTTRIKEERIDKKIEFNAQFAKRFSDIAMRIGMTENTFGVGSDYFFLKDKGKIYGDAWDFSNDEEGAKNPHVKFGVDYFLFKNIFMSAGVDNILNRKQRGGYAGVGLRFEDEDFKYLFGSMPKISSR
jgi:phospholipid/cholesterol/gamma-HCH transport system substrate-binding protein